MSRLRRHVIPVVAALFALAVGIALGAGPLGTGSSDEPTTASEGPEVEEDDGSETPAEAPEPDRGTAYADAFAAAAASRLYDKQLLGHPTAIVTLPGVQPGLVEAMVAQVGAAGGGLTGVFEVSASAVDRDETTTVDTYTAQLMTDLADPRIDPAATTYTRLGQLLSVAVATPDKGGQRSSASSDAIRASLGAGGLLTADPAARLAPLLLVLLPATGDDAAATEAAVYSGLLTGLRENAAGVVVLGDTDSGEDGLLADLRADPLVTSTLASVDGSDTVLGQVTGMLAVISALDGSVGAYGASGSDGAVPIS